jgi:hypothetical protein
VGQDLLRRRCTDQISHTSTRRGRLLLLLLLLWVVLTEQTTSSKSGLLLRLILCCAPKHPKPLRRLSCGLCASKDRWFGACGDVAQTVERKTTKLALTICTSECTSSLGLIWLTEEASCLRGLPISACPASTKCICAESRLLLSSERGATEQSSSSCAWLLLSTKGTKTRGRLQLLLLLLLLPIRASKYTSSLCRRLGCCRLTKGATKGTRSWSRLGGVISKSATSTEYGTRLGSTRLSSLTKDSSVWRGAERRGLAERSCSLSPLLVILEA